jgi:hypothetical protein
VIVSHEHRFIFVKTRKTAGTSIEVLLSDLAGRDAVVTPVQPAEPGHEPRNWRGLFNPVPELWDRYGRREPSLQFRSWQSTVSDLRRRRCYFNHQPASLIRTRVGKQVWDDYFTFCFERNPWDKVVSWYFYVTRDNPNRPPFERWVLDSAMPKDWNRYTIGDDVAVDFVGRFECLGDDLAQALERVGITDLPELPRAKGQFRPADPAAAITSAVDRRIREVFADEIGHFGYERPDLA